MILEKAGLELAKKLCEDDPVRKNIPYEWRVADCHREIFHLEEKAVICIAHLNEIPTTEEELMSFGWGTNSIFYTVWSKEKGLGRKIIVFPETIKNNLFNIKFLPIKPLLTKNNPTPI